MLRKSWRRGLVGRAHPLSTGTTGNVRGSVELAVCGMQTLHLQHRSPTGSRVKARASYVDETLFGNPLGTRPSPPDFDPPWVQKTSRTRGVSTAALQSSPAKGSCETTSSRGRTPALMPRKKKKYRLVSHTPSYCDESLFGFRPEGAGWETSWMAKGEAARLRALLWTPPATPRGSHSPRPRETPLRAIHPAGPTKAEPRVAANSPKSSEDGLGVRCPLGRGRSHSLTHLDVPGPGRPAPAAPHTNRPSTSGLTSQKPLLTPRAHSGSVSMPATPRQGRAAPRPKPPWK